MSALVADLLHVTHEGHALARVLLSGAINMLRGRFKSLFVELAECREADFACLNCPWTFYNGKMTPRAPSAGVVVITLDGDLATQIPYGDGCRTRVFLQVLVTGQDFLVRRPADLQRAVVKEMVYSMAKECPVETLFLENFQSVTVAQRLFCFLMWSVAMGDYTLRIKESHFLRDADGFLKTEPLFQVYRAFYSIVKKQGENADVSWPHLIWVAEHGRISYFEAAGLEKSRNRLVAALKDTGNQLEIFYGGISRVVSMFPLRSDRQAPLEMFLKMWPRNHHRSPMKHLYQLVNERGWIQQARDLDFSIRPVILDFEKATSFVSKWFKPAFKPKMATLLVVVAFANVGLKMPLFVQMHVFKTLGGIPGTWFPQHDWDLYYSSRVSVVEKRDLHWRRVELAGSVGPGTAKKAKVEKEKKRTVKDPSDLCEYFDASGREHSAVEEKLAWCNFVGRIVAEPNFRRTLIDRLAVCEEMEKFCAQNGIPLTSTRSCSWSEERDVDICLVGVLGAAMDAGQPPLQHSGFTGCVLRGLSYFITSKSTRKMEWFSNDVVIQPPSEENMVCPECSLVLFPEGHWWHQFADCCDCSVCRSIRNGCETCISINEAFAVYGGVARRWEWKRHNPHFSLLVGNQAKLALGSGPSHFEVLHPGVLFGKANSPEMIQPFWDSLVSAAGQLLAGVNCWNDAPLAPDDQLVLYQMVLESTKYSFPKVPSMERALQLRKLLVSKTLPSNTRGFASANGQLRDDSESGKKKKKKDDVKETIQGAAVRRLIPVKQSIRESAFANQAFGQHERLRMSNAAHANAKSRVNTKSRANAKSRANEESPPIPWATSVFQPFLPFILPYLDRLSLWDCLRVSKAFRREVMAFMRDPASRWQAEGLRLAEYYNLQVDASLQQRELFSQLLVHRLQPIHVIYNKLRALGMLAHELRAIGATDAIDVPVFDRTRSKDLLMDLVAERPLDSAVLLSKYGIHKELQDAFELLRQQGRRQVLEPARALGLAGGVGVADEEDDAEDDDSSEVAETTGPFKSLFVRALGDDMVTRLDVPARSQVVSILRTLFFIMSEGVSNNAFLTVYFAFSSSLENARAELSLLEAEDMDDDEQNASSAAQADATNGEAFLDDEYKPVDDDSDKRAKSSACVLLSRARLAFQRALEEEKSLLLLAGEKLQFVLNCLVPASVYGVAVTAFDRFDAFRKNSSFGVAKARTKGGGDATRRGQAPFQSESIGTIRDRLFSVLLEHIPDHPGLRPAPLPSKAVPWHLTASVFVAVPALRRYLAGPLSEEEKKLFPNLDSSKLSTAVLPETLCSLFNIGGFSYRSTINSVLFNGGSYISAFSMDQKKSSATRKLKSKPDGVKLDELYASAKERAEAGSKAKEKATKRGANVKGPDVRVPVAKKRGYVTENRYFENLEQLHGKAAEQEKVRSGKRVETPTLQRGVFFNARAEDAPLMNKPPLEEPVQFVVKIQSDKQLWKNAELLLEWLKDHPLVVLDPGKRWVVRGIVARFVDGTINNGTLSLSFVYRGLRVSGRKWSFYTQDVDVGVPVECTELKKIVQSALDRMTKEFLQSHDQVGDLKKIFAADGFVEELDESFSCLLDGRAVRRKETRLKHQQRIALNFCRTISSLCEGFGDPIVIVGAAGGNGGRGRAQVNHDLLLNTLAGFYSVIMLDEHCTSKMTTCCHRPAHAPRSKGRSRGCKECSGGTTHWWDRDAGAAWNMLSIYLSLLLTGERPAAMTKVTSRFCSFSALNINRPLKRAKNNVSA